MTDFCKTLIITEDTEACCEVKDAFPARGQAFVTNSGKEALSLLKAENHGFGLLFVFWDDEGKFFINEYRKSQSPIPFIVLYPAAKSEHMAEALALGAEDILGLPTEKEVVKRRADHVLGHYRANPKTPKDFDPALFGEFTDIYLLEPAENKCLPLHSEEDYVLIPSTGCSIEDFISQYSARVHPDQKESFAKIFSKEHIYAHFKADPSPLFGDFLFINNGGNLHWLTLIISKVMAISKTETLLCFFSDRKEIRKAEKEQILKSLLKNIPVGMAIYELGEEIKTKYYNGSLCALLGYDTTEYKSTVHGRDFPIPPDAVKKYTAHINTGIPIEEEHFTEKKDGAKVWLWSISTIVQEGKEPPLCYSVIIDISHTKEREDKLHMEEERFHVLAESCGDVLFDYDCLSRRLTVSYETPNGRVERTAADFSHAIQESGYIHKDSMAALLQAYDNARKAPCRSRIEFNAKFHSEKFLCYKSDYVSVANSQGEVCRILGIARDISEEKQIAQNLQREQHLRNAFFSDCLFSFEYDLNTENIHLLHKNKQRQRDFYPFERYVTQKKLNLVHTEDRVRVLSELKSANLREAYRSSSADIGDQFRILNRHGKWIWVKMSISLFQAEDQTAERCIGYITDISTLKNREIEILSRADKDSLTGICNRGAAERRITQVLTEAANTSHALMLLDLDDFKQINDTYGHLDGDKALRQFGEILCQTFRSDDIIGRFGGDEFILLIRGIKNKQTLLPKLRLLIQRVARLREDNGWQMDTACSIGVSIYPNHGKDLGTLLANADKALYQAKKEGKNHFVFYQQSN